MFSGSSFLIFLKTPPLFKQLYFKESDHAWLLKDSTHYLVHTLCFIHSLEVLVTLTPDVGKILSSLHRVQFKGAINFLTAVKIAHVSVYHFNLFSCYSATGKTVNTWNISGMVIVLWPITKQRSRHLNWPWNHKLINILACGLVFSHLIGFSLAKQ